MKLSFKIPKNWFRGGLAAVALCGVLVYAKSTLNDNPGEFRSSLSISHEAPERNGPLGGYASVVERIEPSVVSIYTEKKLPAREFRSLRPFFSDPFFRRFFGDEFGFHERPDEQPSPRSQPRERGLGSGVVLTSNGYIITNNHVIEGADEIKVRFPGNKHDHDAEVVGRDAPTDVAVLKVKASGLRAAILGDSDQLKVGDLVLAIGNPFGLSRSVTSGIVSALGRKNLNITSYENFIQTDASINPGNSGGALIDNRGRVIGINTAIVPRAGGGNLGIGFAIPVNLAVEVAERLIDDGEIKRGYLGVMLSDLTEELAMAFDTKPKGALVNQVMDDSPAGRAGIKAGDIIIRYDGKKIEDVAQLRLLVAGTEPGRKVAVEVQRDGKDVKLSVRPGSLDSGELASLGSIPAKGSFLDGVRIQTADDELRDRYGIENSKRGAVVVDIDPGSVAAEAGLGVGDLIIEIAHQPVASVEDALRILKQQRNTARVLLLRVLGSQGPRYVAVDMREEAEG